MNVLGILLIPVGILLACLLAYMLISGVLNTIVYLSEKGWIE
jgi:hypothetical protein